MKYERYLREEGRIIKFWIFVISLIGQVSNWSNWSS